MNGPLKSLIVLLSEVAQDCATWCDTSASRDLKTVTVRVEAEGESFLTITLPAFGSDFERCLSQGFVDSSAFPGFHRKQGIPVFLQGFLSRIFDVETGLLLDNPCIMSIRSVRQITLMFGKMKHPCSPERERKAMRGYVQTEKDVFQSDQVFLDSSQGNTLAADFTRIGHMLFGNLYSRVENQLFQHGILPRHSSGSTADRLRGNAKFSGQVWTRRLEVAYPHWEMLIPSVSSACLEWTNGVNILEPGDEVPVRVIFVPKTMKTPRVIAMEPTHMQYVQQGILELLADEIERDDYSSNFISSESQKPNQQLAWEGSLHGKLATLDMSEASDRVSNEHVLALLAKHSILREAVQACRSTKARLPDGSIHELAKFASMGSALCFPFEAMVFLTVIFVGIENALNKQLTHSDIRSLRGRVRVYGDDIIVPVRYVESVVRSLEAYGHKVNAKKSFWTGKFRESCGKEYYDGVDVSIVRVRRHLPEGRRNGQGNFHEETIEQIVSAISLRNQLFKVGYSGVLDLLDNRIRRFIPAPYAILTDELANNSSLLVLHTYDESKTDPSNYKVCGDHQKLLIRVPVVSSKPPVNELDGVGALMKWFLNAERGNPPFHDKDHLVRSGRPNCARIIIGWRPV